MRLFAAVLLAGVAMAPAAEYTIDSAHSSAGFAVRHMMVTNVRGQFSKVAGKISYDPANLAASKVEATIDATTVDTREPKRDTHLKSPDFFDVALFPTITFRSTKWWKEGEKVKVAGDLTMHGVTKSVVLDLDGPHLQGKVIGASATTKLSRKEFGLTWNRVLEAGGVSVGDEVTVTLEIEAK